MNQEVLKDTICKQKYQKYHIEIKETLLGDPNFNNINIKELLSENFILDLCQKISLDKTYLSKKAYVTSNPETVYLSVVDKDLNSVSFINSICHSFGSTILLKNSVFFFKIVVLILD